MDIYFNLNESALLYIMSAVGTCLTNYFVSEVYCLLVSCWFDITNRTCLLSLN